MMLAHELQRTGLSIALIEGAKVQQGVADYTTGKLTSQHGLIYHKIHRSLGLEAATHYFEANQMAINAIRQLATENDIECGMTTDNAHVLIRDEKNESDFDAEIQTLLAALIPHLVSETPDPRHGGLATVAFPNQAHFHPRKFLMALLDQLGDNVSVYENSRILEVNNDEVACTLTLEDGEVRARKTVMATNYPILDSDMFVAKIIKWANWDLDRPSR